MTPKEKAVAFVQAFIDGGFLPAAARIAALIAIDEILTWFKAHSYSNKNYDAFVFYNEVKQEIENL